MPGPLWILLLTPLAVQQKVNLDPLADAPALAARIDAFVEKHWRESKVKPALPVDDAAFLRRITLDLAGRIPSRDEAVAFARDRRPDRRGQTIKRLMLSPEYSLHLGRVLDDMIQEKYAGGSEFLDYLRTAVGKHKAWDQVFREVMLGPWDVDDTKGADGFLIKRVRSLDDLTNDTARIFFGVNVSCAKCHNHPLVADWTQDHYYGMASFFTRTIEASKEKRKGKNKERQDLSEKATSDIVFMTKTGEKRTARLMFLSSRFVEEAPAKTVKVSFSPAKATAPAPASRRALLVKAALEEKTFFSRALVNRLWAYYMGRGLVQPVDQMHSANPPAIPGLLEWLAADFSDHGYNLDRLIAGLISSKVYQLQSIANAAGEEPSDGAFAVAPLRALTPQQFAFSLSMLGGEQTPSRFKDARGWTQWYKDLEGRAAALTKSEPLDPRSDHFQSSTAEALYLSNNPEIQKLFLPANKNLAARLGTMKDGGQVVDAAFWTILSRPPDNEEKAYLAHWLDDRRQTWPRACGELAWALVTSAEFRFNH